MNPNLSFLKSNRFKIIAAIFIPVLVLSIWLILKPKDTPPKVADLLPHSQTIPPTQFFTIIFENTPSSHQKPLLKVTFQPQIKFSTEFKDQNLIITPQQLLSPGQDYIITLLYKDSPYLNTTFHTKTLNQMTSDEEQLFQAQADQNYADQLSEYYKQNPWVLSLPIDTKDYTIVYDPELQAIRVSFKTKSSPALKDTITKALSSKGIPTTKIVWIEPTPSK